MDSEVDRRFSINLPIPDNMLRKTSIEIFREFVSPFIYIIK